MKLTYAVCNSKNRAIGQVIVDNIFDFGIRLKIHTEGDSVSISRES